MTFVLLYTVFPDRVVADQILEELVRDQLVVCTNILGDGVSMYLWKGLFEKTMEIYCLLKTTPDRVDKVYAFFQQKHPYEAFPLFKISAESMHEPYNSWVKDEMKLL